MTTLLLIRHGENEYVRTGRLAGRLPGVHLNEKGRTQALALAERIKDWPVKAVYSSPLDRTMETAQPIAAALGLEVIPRTGLLETDVGEWQDKKLKGLIRLNEWRTVQASPSVMQFPGGETFAACQHRIVHELETLRRMHEQDDLIACVFHSDPIKLAVAYYLGLPLDLFQRLGVSTASITALHVGKFGSRLLALNYDLSFTLAKE